MFSFIIHIYNHLDEYKIGLVNGITFVGLTFFEVTKWVELIGQIILIIASLIFTYTKYLEIQERRKRNKNKNDD